MRPGYETGSTRSSARSPASRSWACARRTATYSGSRGAAEIVQQDFEDAVDRLQMGKKSSGRAMNEAEKARVAVHESGHALVALSVEYADPVHRVTIIPRQIGSLGATLQLPTEERYLMTERELRRAVGLEERESTS